MDVGKEDEEQHGGTSYTEHREEAGNTGLLQSRVEEAINREWLVDTLIFNLCFDDDNLSEPDFDDDSYKRTRYQAKDAFKNTE